MPLHALELVLDAESDAWVRAEWAALAEAGLPSQARHAGASNAPHVTVASAARIDGGQEERAARSARPLLPARFGLAGVVLLGRGPYALARLVAPDAAWQAAAAGIRADVGDPHSPGWLAHVTLARRVRPEQVSAALAVVATGPAVPDGIGVAGLRRWNPDTATVTTLAGHPAP